MTSAQIASSGAGAGANTAAGASPSRGPAGPSAERESDSPSLRRGQKAIGGGWEDPGGFGHGWDDGPTPDGSAWKVYMTMDQGAPGNESGELYAVRLR